MKVVLSLIVLANICQFATCAEFTDYGWPYAHESLGSYEIVDSISDLGSLPTKATAVRFVDIVFEDHTVLDSLSATEVWFDNCQFSWAKLTKCKAPANYVSFRCSSTYLSYPWPSDKEIEAQVIETEIEMAACIAGMGALQSLWIDKGTFHWERLIDIERKMKISGGEYVLTEILFETLCELNNIESLRIDGDVYGITESHDLQAFSQLAEITTLRTLFMPDIAISDKCLNILLENLHLTSLDLSAVRLSEASLIRIAGLEGIEHLGLKGNVTSADYYIPLTDEFYKKLSAQPQLKTLILSGFKNETEDGFREIYKCQSLEKLNLTICDCSNYAWLSGMSQLVSLRTLRLCMYGMTDSEFTDILSGTNLHSIDIIYSPMLTVASIRALEKQIELKQLRIPGRMAGKESISLLTRLESITIFDTEEIKWENNTARTWWRWPARLDISYHEDITIDDVNDLLSKRKGGVDALDISGLDCSKPKTLMGVLGHFSRLKWLDIRHTDSMEKLTATASSKLAKKFKSLKLITLCIDVDSKTEFSLFSDIGSLKFLRLYGDEPIYHHKDDTTKGMALTCLEIAGPVLDKKTMTLFFTARHLRNVSFARNVIEDDLKNTLASEYPKIRFNDI